jgi:hypothetical protein
MRFVVDGETIINCSVFVFEEADVETNPNVYCYVIHDLRNDLEDLCNFLDTLIVNKDVFVSFNGIAFDSQIIQFIIRNREDLLNLPGSQVAYNIYLKAQQAIKRSNNKEFAEYGPFELSIPHIDVFKQGHFDSAAKRASLKYLQFTTDWYNIEEMPIHHSTVINSLDQIEEIISYCKNDVSSTKHLYKIFTPQTTQREIFSEKYKMDLLSSSEPSIAKKIFSYYLAPKMRMNPRDFKALRTFRESIVVKDIILPYTEFKSEEFKNLLEAFRELVIDPEKTKDAFKHCIKTKGIIIDYGLGGVHGARLPGIYKSDSKYSLESFDVISFYPNLAIKNKWSPAHIPVDIFCAQYEWFFNERVKIPKKDPVNYLFKIILNSAYGLTNERNSPFYDPLMTMSITINGQLSLMLLFEDILLSIPDAIPVLVNTDGAEFLIPRDKMDIYKECCKRWEERTSLSLEFDSYKELIIRDVNNYIGIYKERECSNEDYLKLKSKGLYPCREDNGKYYFSPTKCKGGAFEFTDLALHKNKSFLIKRKALYNYFVFGKLPEQTLKANKNIFDYCGGIKSSSEWKLVALCNDSGSITESPLQKVTRYYISKKGCKIIKVNTVDGRKIQQHSGNVYQTVYNVHSDESWIDYNINDKFYLDSIYEEISNIVKKSENTLF